MLVMMTPLHDDGTRNESLSTMVVDEREVDVQFPPSPPNELEAYRFNLFREAKRLFESDPALLERMNKLIDIPKKGFPNPAPTPNPRNKELMTAVADLHQVLFPADGEGAGAMRIVVAPDDHTINIHDWVRWVVWHLKPESELAVYGNGQPFGDPLYEIYRDEDAPHDDYD